MGLARWVYLYRFCAGYPLSHATPVVPTTIGRSSLAAPPAQSCTQAPLIVRTLVRGNAIWPLVAIRLPVTSTGNEFPLQEGRALEQVGSIFRKCRRDYRRDVRCHQHIESLDVGRHPGVCRQHRPFRATTTAPDAARLRVRVTRGTPHLCARTAMYGVAIPRSAPARICARRVIRLRTCSGRHGYFGVFRCACPRSNGQASRVDASLAERRWLASRPRCVASAVNFRLPSPSLPYTLHSPSPAMFCPRHFPQITGAQYAVLRPTEWPPSTIRRATFGRPYSYF